jgi:hypothetical protein
VAGRNNCDKITRRAKFRLTRRANQNYQFARLTRQEGRCATSQNVWWDAVDASDGGDDRRNTRTAKSCGPGVPMLASSFAGGDIREMTVANKPDTGEITK